MLGFQVRPCPWSAFIFGFLLSGMFGVCVTSGLRADGDKETEESALEKVVKEFLGSSEWTDEAKIESYVRSAYSPQFLEKLPLSMHVRMHRLMGGEKGGLFRVEEERRTDTSATLIVRTGRGRKLRLSIEIESEASPLITKLGLSDAPEPKPEGHNLDFGFPKTIAGRAMSDWYRAFSAKDLRVMEKFIRRRFEPGYVEERGLETLVGLHEQLGFVGGDLDPVEVLSSSELEVTILADDGHQGVELTIRTSSGEEGRIDGLGVVPRGSHRGEKRRRRDRAKSFEEFCEGLEKEVEALAEEGSFSGGILVSKGEGVGFEKTWGWADRDREILNRKETLFNLASMGKMFTAVSIAQLVEAGKLSFETRVGEVLPEVASEEIRREVSVWHLLTHTAGLGAGEMARVRKRASRDSLQRHEDWLEAVSWKPLRSRPGERFEYSNLGYLLLGRILEVKTAKRYSEVVLESICRPAKMERTRFLTARERSPERAEGYRRSLGGPRDRWSDNREELFFCGLGAGGVYSTLGDLERFARALMDGTLLSLGVVRRLTEPVSPGPSGGGYGAGFGVWSGEGARSFGHTGGFVGVSTAMRVYPESGVVAIVLSNVGEGATPVMESIAQSLPGE